VRGDGIKFVVGHGERLRQAGFAAGVAEDLPPFFKRCVGADCVE
jgi:hypothetical protein